MHCFRITCHSGRIYRHPRQKQFVALYDRRVHALVASVVAHGNAEIQIVVCQVEKGRVAIGAQPILVVWQASAHARSCLHELVRVIHLRAVMVRGLTSAGDAGHRKRVAAKWHVSDNVTSMDNAPAVFDHTIMHKGI